MKGRSAADIIVLQENGDLVLTRSNIPVSKLVLPTFFIHHSVGVETAPGRKVGGRICIAEEHRSYPAYISLQTSQACT